MVDKWAQHGHAVDDLIDYFYLLMQTGHPAPTTLCQSDNALEGKVKTKLLTVGREFFNETSLQPFGKPSMTKTF